MYYLNNFGVKIKIESIKTAENYSITSIKLVLETATEKNQNWKTKLKL